MKFEPHLPQLPSIGELLEHPRVKGVVDRINRSTVAQRATGFLEELRETVAERAGKFEVPPLGHLADRLVRRLLGEPVGHGPAINATGVVIGARELTPPLADAAVHAMLQLAGEYHDRGQRLQKAADGDLAALASTEAVLAVNNFDAALAIALAATTANRDALLAGTLDSSAGEIDWRGIAARSGVSLRNGADRSAAEAGWNAASHPAALIRTVEAEPWLPTADAAQLAQQRSVLLIDVAPFAGLIDPQEHGLASVATISQRLAAGADLAIVDGAGLLGGPSCGLIFGRRELIDACANHPLARLAAIDPLRAASLQTTAQLYRDDLPGVIFTVPVWQLLSTPLANLKQRAERLAPLIAAIPGIASAEAVSGDSAWLRAGGVEFRSPDWSIVIRRRDGRATDLAHALAAASRPIIGETADEFVTIRLRSVFPRWDQQLVAEVERAVA